MHALSFRKGVTILSSDEGKCDALSFSASVRYISGELAALGRSGDISHLNNPVVHCRPGVALCRHEVNPLCSDARGVNREGNHLC